MVGVNSPHLEGYMELEQLVGFVRHQRAKLAGFEALDEVLTVVLEASDRVKAAEALVMKAQQDLVEAQVARDEIEDLATRRVAAVDAEVAAKRERLVEALNGEKSALEIQIDQLKRDREQHVHINEGLMKEHERLEAEVRAAGRELTRVEAEVNRVRKNLFALKESIK